MATKQFHLASILSITTGFLFPVPGTQYAIDGVYNILNYMTGDNLQTLALPRAAQECRPYLLEQLPFTKDINCEDLRGNKNAAAWESRLAILVAQYGAFHPVRPIGAEDHEVLNPLEDLKRLRPDMSDDNVIIIDTSDDDIDPTGSIDWKA